MDPRIPDENEAFALRLSNTPLKATKIEWLIDGKVIGTSSGKQEKFLWNLELGTHVAQAKIWNDSDTPLTTASVRFYVKSMMLAIRFWPKDLSGMRVINEA